MKESEIIMKESEITVTKEELKQFFEDAILMGQGDCVGFSDTSYRLAEFIEIDPTQGT